MKNYTMKLQCEGEMDCPKEVVMWNYYDHEHLVGTHAAWYSKARILAERDDWALVYRKGKMPFLRIPISGIALQFMDGNCMKTFHKDSVGFLLEQETYFDDLPNDRSKVTIVYKINVPRFMKIFEPMFQKLFKNWFHEVWQEDAPMRLRRWKVHKLGFNDFSGVDYINKKLPKPTKDDYPKYVFKPPVKTFSPIDTPEGFERPFADSVKLGYND